MDWTGHKIIRNGLKQLSDKSYQERVWAKDARPEMSSFEEAVCQVYDDSGLDIAYGKGQEVYGEKIDGLLKDLGTALRGIPINQPPAKLVVDEKMVPVRKMAANILQLIEQQGNQNPEDNVRTS